MKLKNTILLMILALGAFAYIWFVERHEKTTKQLAEEGNRVLKFDRDKINDIVIKSNEAKIELKKDDKGVWQLIEPVKDRADSMALSQLFTESEALKYVEKIDNKGKGATKEQLKEFGLSDPATRLRFSGGDKPVEILFGKDTATEGKVYVKLDNSNAVYVIGNSLKSQIGKKADEFRDRKLTDISTTRVNKAALKTPAGEIEFSKDKDNHWTLNKPLKARGDDSKIGDLISQAANARVESFIADAANLSGYGLQEPRATFTIHAEGSEQPVVLQLGGHPKDEKEKDKVYAKLSTRDTVVLLPKSIESLIETKPNDLRDKNLIRVDADIVDRIGIEGAGGEKIVLARSGESWVRKDGDKDIAINVAAARRLLDDLRQQQVTNFVADVATELPKYGLDQPRVKVTLSSYASQNTAETKAGEKPIVSILFGKSEGGNTYAKLDDEPFIVAVPDMLLEDVLIDPLQWQPLEIYKNKADDITSLEIRKEGQPTLSLERDKEKTWKLSKGDGKVNQMNITSLVNTLATLRAVRWAGAATGEQGLDKPAITVSFKTSGNAGGKLSIGKVTGDELWPATAEGVAGVFLVSRPDKEAFDLALIEKPPQAVPLPNATAPPDPAVPPPPAPEPAKEAPKPPSPAEAPAPRQP